MVTKSFLSVSIVCCFILRASGASVCTADEIADITTYTNTVPACKDFMDAYSDFVKNEENPVTRTGLPFTQTPSNLALVCPCLRDYADTPANNQLDCKLQYFYSKISLYEERAQCLITENDIYPDFIKYQVKCDNTIAMNGTSALSGETGVSGCLYACAKTIGCTRFSYYKSVDGTDNCARVVSCSDTRHDDGLEGLFEIVRRTTTQRVWQEEIASNSYRRFLKTSEAAKDLRCKADQVMMPSGDELYCTTMGNDVFCDRFDETYPTQCVHTLSCTGFAAVDCPGVAFAQSTGGFKNADDNKERIEQLLTREMATMAPPDYDCVAIGDEDDTCKTRN